MERACPKCGKDYSTDPYWSTSLKRHINRKNSCIRSRDTKYIRNTDEVSKPKGPEAHDLSHIELEFNGSTISSALAQIFDNYNSVCQPNISRDIIMYYINGKVHHSSLAQFIYTIWYCFLIPRVFPIIKERGWDYKTYKFRYDVTDPYMPKPLSIARYKQSPYFTSDYYRYVEKSEAYPNIRNRLIQYFKQVSKQRRSEIRDLLLSQACQPET
jgi:hypothetical protein